VSVLQSVRKIFGVRVISHAITNRELSRARFAGILQVFMEKKREKINYVTYLRRCGAVRRDRGPRVAKMRRVRAARR